MLLTLTQGKFAIVDDDAPESVTSRKWRITPNGYVITSIYNGKQSIPQHTTVYLHRLIMNCPKNQCVDHANGDKLDNRRSNLRICSSAENARNGKIKGNSKQPYKGVTRITRKSHCYFRVRIRFNYEYIVLGYFDTAENAARVYDAAAAQYHGDFALLNFPEEIEKSIAIAAPLVEKWKQGRDEWAKVHYGGSIRRSRQETRERAWIMQRTGQ